MFSGSPEDCVHRMRVGGVKRQTEAVCRLAENLARVNSHETPGLLLLSTMLSRQLVNLGAGEVGRQFELVRVEHDERRVERLRPGGGILQGQVREFAEIHRTENPGRMKGRRCLHGIGHILRAVID